MSQCDQTYTGPIEIPDPITLNFYSLDIAPEPPTPGNPRNIHLSWDVSRYYFHTTDGIRIRITADNANLMPTKIFAYQLLPLKPGAAERVGAFDHVCSPVDLEEYPEDEPLAGSRPAWFRLNYVDVLLRSRAEAQAFIKEVVEDVKRLKNTLDIAEDLIPGGDLWIGTPPAEAQ